MKNLPHQFNRLPTLRAVLATAGDLGPRTRDDADFGYELALRGIYRFRSLTTSLAARIAVERLKTTGNQGARTAARDLRRLLTDLGYLGGAPSWGLTTLGLELLAAPAGTPQEAAVWQAAITNLTVTDIGGNTSHPGCILLQLLADTGGLPKHALGLALEPEDDSEPEYLRARGLTGLDPAARRAALGISRYEDEDAVKILPALAEQAGLIQLSAGSHVLTAAGVAARTRCGPGTALAAAATPIPLAGGSGATVAPTPRAGAGSARTSRPRAPQSRARRWADRPAGVGPGDLDEASFNALTAEAQVAAARLRRERTRRHDIAVEQLAQLADAQGGVDLHEDPLSFDLVVEPLAEADDLVLAEVKTLEDDVDTQARLAIGQLLWYRYRVVEGMWPGRGVELLVVFDGEVPAGIVSVFDELDIGVCIVNASGYRPVNDAAARTKRRFGA